MIVFLFHLFFPLTLTSSDIYDLREIQKEFLPELKPKEKRKGRPKKINYVYRERSLYYARIHDITKLCELREYDLRGHREIILFLYRYYLCSFTEDTKKALEDVLELNSMFISPLKENEVIKRLLQYRLPEMKGE